MFGPLINTAVKVIGINDVIFTEGGGNDGIGFAVAIDGAPILDQSQLFAAVVSHRPGAAEIEIVRDGRLITIDVTLEGVTP